MLLRAAAHPRCARGSSIGARRLARLARGALGVAGALAAGLVAAPLPASAAVPVPLQLVTATPVVGVPGGIVAVTLARRGAIAAPNATVQLTLFGALTTRFGLEAAIGTPGPSGPVATTRPMRAACLPGTTRLSVVAGLASATGSVHTPTQCGRPAPILRAPCSAVCDGVYPIEVTVRGDGVVQSLVVLVTFAARARAPLRVAWVLRVAGTTGLVSAAADLAALGRRPLVPLTVDVQGQAVADSLGLSTGPASLAALDAAVASPHHELIEEPYAPADLGALAASGLVSEALRQFALTDAVLRAAGVTAPVTTTVSVGSGPQTPTAAHAAAAVGVHHLLVNGGELATDPSDTLSWGSPFLVAGDGTGPTALASDTELSELSDDNAADPALAANAFLGTLAFLHFEQPDLAEPRVALVLTEATRAVSPAFVADVVSGLGDDPVLVPITASSAFSITPVGANGFPSVRAMALPPSRPWPRVLVDTLRSLRRGIAALHSAIVPSSASPLTAIEAQLLEAECDVAPLDRAAILGAVHHAVVSQRAFFHFYSGPITLTSRGATSIPITVISSAPYLVHAVVQVTSPRIAIPHHDYPFTFGSSGVYTFRVPARALVNGDLPLSVVLLTPDGRLVLAHAMITVRVTGFSVVGIALTVLAVLVLAAWWLRTARRKRVKA